MDTSKIDYTLYLVTDSTPAILGNRDIVEVVEAALKGGVTIVQYRDKSSDTGVLISTAKKIHAITQKYNVPLLINDRVDVALAVGCEGVHIGQDDMDLPTARKLLGPQSIIGVTASSVPEALTACKDGASYLGIGTMFATPTKTNAKDIIGTSGTQAILGVMSKNEWSKDVPTVSIGGINSTNIQRVLFQSSHASKSLSGIAIVSAIMGSPDPSLVASTLLKLIKTPPPFVSSSLTTPLPTLITAIPSLIHRITTLNPLSHNITNTVVQNTSANLALAIGGSPIMSSSGLEAPDLAKLNGSLLLNTGTITPSSMHDYILALQAYNSIGGPVVYDPVGAGATSIRRDAVRTMLAAGYFDVIKGNEGEILAVYHTSPFPSSTSTSSQPETQQPQQKGVSSSPSTLSPAQKATLVSSLAQRTKSTILMTGPTDYLSNGVLTLSISNGHSLLSSVTGSGCVLGTLITCALAVEREDKMAAVLAAVLVFEIAAERAVVGREGEKEGGEGGVRGPASFWTGVVDEVWRVRGECVSFVEGREKVSGELPAWLDGAKVVDVSSDVGEVEI